MRSKYRLGHSFVSRVGRAFMITWVLTCLLSWVLTGCGTSKKVISQEGQRYTQLTKKQFIKLYATMEAYPALSAKGKMGVRVDGAERDINLQGIGIRWQQEQGKGYELSIRPWAFMEIGKVSVAGDTLLIIDRYDKYYYLQTSARRELNRVLPFVGLDVKMLESMVENRPFSFVESGVDALRRMDMKATTEGYTFTHQIRPGGNSIKHTFDTSLNLKETYINLPGEGVLMVTYGQFVQLANEAGKRPVPTVIQIELKGAGEKSMYGMLRFDLEQVEAKEPQDWSIQSPSGYRRVMLNDVIKILKELSRL